MSARRDDRQLRLEIIGLRNWEPLGVVNALYLPDMFDERKWPPPDLAQRMIGTGDERVMAVRAATFLHEILEPVKRWRNPRLFRNVLDWGCGVGLLERFMPRFLPNAAVTGIDWDEEAIEWCRAALPGKFVVVPGQPPAELPVGPVDLVLGYSVLPRLDRQGQQTWLDAIGKGDEEWGVCSAHPARRAAAPVPHRRGRHRGPRA